MTVKLHNPTPEIEPDYHAFDLFFCWGQDKVSRAISSRTSWPLGPKRFRYAPCHVAFCCMFESRPVWVESTMLCEHECLYRKLIVAGPQMHEIDQRLIDYRRAKGRVELWRIVPFMRLSNSDSGELTRSAIGDFVVKHYGYDLHGAIFAGAFPLKLVDLFLGGGLYPAVRDQSLFCSEWAAALAMKFGLLAPGNYRRYSPADLGRALATNGMIQFVRSFESDA